MDSLGNETTPNWKKLIRCANWLQYCLDIGWDKKDMPKLQKLWMDFHDDEGNVIYSEEVKESARQ